MRRAARCLLHAPWLALLATWPLSGWYTSLGIDVEAVEHGALRGDYWRLRWPGDGSVVVGRIRERRAAVAGDRGEVDLGGAFLQPPPPLHPRTTLEAAGFWWVDADAAVAPVPDIVDGADRAFLVGVPHGLLLALAAAVAAGVEWRHWRHRRVLAIAARPA